MSEIFATPQRQTKVALSSGTNKNISIDDLPEADLLIIVVDVGQGESTIVVERTAKKDGMKPTWVAIIDGGYPTAGRGAMARYLRALEIQQIDLMVCTHFDGDHTRGLTDFLAVHAIPAKKKKAEREITISIKPNEEPAEGFTVKTLLVRSNDHSSFKSQTKLDLLGVADTKVETIVEAADWKTLDTGYTTITCLAQKSGSVQDENEGSIALRLEHAGLSYYTAGDLPSHLEDKIKQKPVTAFKCGHHGSKGSTSPEFLEAIGPKYAFISCGDQGFGHPTYAVLERLLAPESTVEHVFLTNCIHNRRGANPTYEKAALTMKKRYETELTKRWPESLKPIQFADDYDKEYVKRLGKAQEACKELKSTDRPGREFGLYLNAALGAATHHLAELDLESKKVTVAGSQDKPGTIVLRFAGKRCTVGCSCDGTWTWFGADEDALEKALGGAIDTALVGEDGLATTNVDSPQKTVKGQVTTAYAAHVVDRAEVYDKNRFGRITVSGLRERIKGAEYIPFCFDKECVKEDDENDPLFHLECGRCLDDEIYVHAACYARSMKNVELDFVNDGSMCEVAVDPNECPHCAPDLEEYQKKKTISRSVGSSEGVACKVCNSVKGNVESDGAKCANCRQKVPAHGACWKTFKPKNAFRCPKCS